MFTLKRVEKLGSGMEVMLVVFAGFFAAIIIGIGIGFAYASRDLFPSTEPETTN